MSKLCLRLLIAGWLVTGSGVAAVSAQESPADHPPTKVPVDQHPASSATATCKEAGGTSPRPFNGGPDPRLAGDVSWALGLTPLPGADLTIMISRRTGVRALIAGLPAILLVAELGPRIYLLLGRTSPYIEGGLMLSNFSLYGEGESVQTFGGSAALGIEHQFRSRVTVAAAGGVYATRDGVAPLVRLMVGYRF